MNFVTILRLYTHTFDFIWDFNVIEKVFPYFATHTAHQQNAINFHLFVHIWWEIFTVTSFLSFCSINVWKNNVIIIIIPPQHHIHTKIDFLFFYLSLYNNLSLSLFSNHTHIHMHICLGGILWVAFFSPLQSLLSSTFFNFWCILYYLYIQQK